MAGAPGIGIHLLDGPATTANDPRAHTYIVDNMAPGSTTSRHIAVTNGDAQPTHVLAYPQAAAISNGAFAALEGRAPSELTTWMTMSPSEATIQPGATLPVTVTIAVPSTAGGGERYGAALVEVPAAPAPQGGVKVVSRVGIRVYLSVSSGATPPSAFLIDTLTAGRDAAGQPWVSVQVHNTGGRALDLSGDLRLGNGPAGLSAGPFPAKLGTTLAVGDHESVKVLLDRQLPAGPWDARVRLVSGLVTEEATGRPDPSGRRPQHRGPCRGDPRPDGIVPGAAVAGGAVVLAAAVGGLLHRHRRKASRGGRLQPSGPRRSR